MRRREVAALAGMPLDQVHPATANEVRRAYADSAASAVVTVATQAPAAYWRVGDRYYLDDPYFGPVVALDDLRYSPDLGLYDVRAFGQDR
jgi:hypothetical protein